MHILSISSFVLGKELYFESLLALVNSLYSIVGSAHAPNLT